MFSADLYDMRDVSRSVLYLYVGVLGVTAAMSFGAVTWLIQKLEEKTRPE